jgi:hypothetical protein
VGFTWGFLEDSPDCSFTYSLVCSAAYRVLSCPAAYYSTSFSCGPDVRSPPEAPKGREDFGVLIEMFILLVGQLNLVWTLYSDCRYTLIERDVQNVRWIFNIIGISAAGTTASRHRVQWKKRLAWSVVWEAGVPSSRPEFIRGIDLTGT